MIYQVSVYDEQEISCWNFQESIIDLLKMQKFLCLQLPNNSVDRIKEIEMARQLYECDMYTYDGASQVAQW